MAQYVYTMNRVGKIVPPKRQILKNISLSFFPGAKIGVLGLNGSGKSTLLKIMAGVDKEIEGEAMPMPGLKHRLPAAGAAARSRADGARGGRGGHGRGARSQGEARRGLRRLRRARRRFRQARRRAGQARSHHRHRRHGHRAPARDRRRRAAPAAVGREDRQRCRAARSAASRCAGCCCPSPTCCCSTSRPTTSTPRASTGSSSSCSASRAPWSAITHDRYFLDNAAEWILELDRGRGIPWKGNYSSWLEQKERAPGAGAEAARTRAPRR